MAYQVSVFMQNKPGQLEKVTGILQEAQVNIRAVTLSSSASGWGILNLLVDRPEAAQEALRAHKITAALRRIMVVEVDDHPGGLHKVLLLLAQAGLNVENATGSVLEKGQRAILVIDVEHVEEAEELLAGAGVRLVAEEAIYSL